MQKKNKYFIKITETGKNLQLKPVPEPGLEPGKIKKAVPELEPVPEKFLNFPITSR